MKLFSSSVALYWQSQETSDLWSTILQLKGFDLLDFLVGSIMVSFFFFFWSSNNELLLAALRKAMKGWLQHDFCFFCWDICMCSLWLKTFWNQSSHNSVFLQLWENDNSFMCPELLFPALIKIDVSHILQSCKRSGHSDWRVLAGKWCSNLNILILRMQAH